MRNAVAVLAILVLGTASGCGTIANMRGERVVSMSGPLVGPYLCPTKPFGGVIQDASVAVEMPGGFLLLADLPFSLVGDLVTLPWTIFVHVREQWNATSTLTERSQ